MIRKIPPHKFSPWPYVAYCAFWGLAIFGGIAGASWALMELWNWGLDSQVNYLQCYGLVLTFFGISGLLHSLRAK